MRDEVTVDTAQAQRQCHFVTTERTRRIAIDIAGELIQHKDQRKAPVSAVSPGIKPGRQGGDDGRFKPRPDGVIKRVIFLEPVFGCDFLEPEMQNLREA